MNRQKDKLELRELVDMYEILADEMNVHEQAKLYTENGILEWHMNGIVHTFQGRSDIEKSCKNVMYDFHTHFHQNGQAVFEFVDETLATGTVYNISVCIGKNEQGMDIMTTNRIVYHDTYEKVNDTWLMAKRETHLVWTKSEVYGEGEYVDF